MSDNHIEPRRDIGNWWNEHKPTGKNAGPWKPSTVQEHSFQKPGARLVTPDTRTPLQRRADERHDLKVAHMDDMLMLDLLSIRVKAHDRKHKGKIVDTWIRGVLIRRIVEKTKPTRAGIDHNKYSICLALLCLHNVAEPEPSGKLGYQWAHGYQHIGQRLPWLVAFVKREGEMRKLSGPQRFQVFE